MQKKVFCDVIASVPYTFSFLYKVLYDQSEE